MLPSPEMNFWSMRSCFSFDPRWAICPPNDCHVKTWSRGSMAMCWSSFTFPRSSPAVTNISQGARVDEPEVAPLLEGDHDVGMGRERHPLVASDELAAHAEMDHKHVTVVQEQQDVLPTAVGLQDLAADQPVDELLAPAVPADDPHGILRRSDLGRGDLAAHDVLFEVSPHHLDFGKLHLRSLRPRLDGALRELHVGFVGGLLLGLFLGAADPGA